MHVRTAGGQTVRAQRVIIAMGSADRTRIEHSPALPAAYAGWASAWPTTVANKYHLIYPSAAWRTKDVTVPAMNAGVLTLWDDSPPSGVPGIVMVLSEQLLPEPLMEKALAALASLQFRANNHTEYHRKQWDVATSNVANCVGGQRAGVLTEHGAGWRNALGRVHWAGSDTADHWQGYISGAIDSGRRAAAEVSAALRMA